MHATFKNIRSEICLGLYISLKFPALILRSFLDSSLLKKIHSLYTRTIFLTCSVWIVLFLPALIASKLRSVHSEWTTDFSLILIRYLNNLVSFDPRNFRAHVRVFIKNTLISLFFSLIIIHRILNFSFRTTESMPRTLIPGNVFFFS